MKKPVKKIKKAKPLSKKLAVIAKDSNVIKAEKSAQMEAKIEKVCAVISKYQNTVQKKGYELTEARFHQGVALKDIIGKGKDEYGKKAIKTIATKVELSEGYLYDLHDLAAYFDYSVDKMATAFEKRISDGKPAGIKYLLKMANENEDAMKDPEKRERAKQKAIGRIEDGARASQEIQEKGLGDDETMGATMALADELQTAGDAMLGDHGKSGIQHTERQSLPEYKKFIREECVCAITGTANPDPHHIIYLSRGKQGSDLSCIPLSRDVHDEVQRIGPKKAEAKYSKMLGKKISFGEILMHTHYLFMKDCVKKMRKEGI